MLKPISKTLEIALSNARHSIAIYEARCAAMPIHNPSTTNRTAGQLLAAMASRHPDAPRDFKQATKTLRQYKSDMLATLDDVSATIRETEDHINKWQSIASHIEAGGALPNDLPFEIKSAASSVRGAVTAGYFGGQEVAAEIRRSLESAAQQVEDAKARRNRVLSVGKIAAAKRMAGSCQVLSGINGFSLEDRKMFARVAELAGHHAKQRLKNYRAQYGKFNEVTA
jgi:uncharacterized protein YoxC